MSEFDLWSRSDHEGEPHSRRGVRQATHTEHDGELGTASMMHSTFLDILVVVLFNRRHFIPTQSDPPLPPKVTQVMIVPHSHTHLPTLDPGFWVFTFPTKQLWVVGRGPPKNWKSDFLVQRAGERVWSLRMDVRIHGGINGLDFEVLPSQSRRTGDDSFLRASFMSVDYVSPVPAAVRARDELHLFSRYVNSPSPPPPPDIFRTQPYCTSEAAHYTHSRMIRSHKTLTQAMEDDAGLRTLCHVL